MDKLKQTSSKRNSASNKLSNSSQVEKQRISIRWKRMLMQGKAHSANRVMTSVSIMLVSTTVVSLKKNTLAPRMEAKSMKRRGKRVTVVQGITIARSSYYRSKWYIHESHILSNKKVPYWYGIRNEVISPHGVKRSAIKQNSTVRKYGI